MHRFRTLTLTAMSLLMLGVALYAGDALGQTAKDLVGTWTWVSVDNMRSDGTKVQPLGPTPKGFLIFDSNGRFAYLLTRPGRAKFAVNNREQGTPEEIQATVQGSLGYSGTYSVSDKTLIFNIEASTYPNAEGTEQKRSFTLMGDELKWTNPAPTTGGTAEAVLKRVK
jgi:Lipocalin-like domain